MNETGTMDDAAAIFSALRGDLVIELLSRLETDDAQRLLATSAKKTPTAIELDRASTRLRASLNRPNSQFRNSSDQARSAPSNGAGMRQDRSRRRQDRSRRRQKHSAKPRSKHSLDFLIDWPSPDVQRLLSKVSTACWAPALKQESSLVLDAIFNNVAPAVERLLRQEIQSFDGNSQVTRISRQKIIAAATDLDLLTADPARRQAG